MIKRRIFVLALLLLSLSFASAFNLHSVTSVPIIVDGTQRSLDSGATYFVGTHSYSAPSIVMGEHNPAQIWVSVQGGEMTLLAALQTSSTKLCPNPSLPMTYSGIIPNPGHLATDVVLASNKSLQQAINEGAFCGCTPGATRTIDCDYLDGTCRNYNDVNATCQASGTWNTPACNSYTNTGRGITCPSGSACSGGACIMGITWGTCDGSGSCMGYYGSDCTTCPYGYTQFSTADSDGHYDSYCNYQSGSLYLYGQYYTGSAWSSWQDQNGLCQHRYGCGSDVCYSYYDWRQRPS